MQAEKSICIKFDSNNMFRFSFLSMPLNNWPNISVSLFDKWRLIESLCEAHNTSTYRTVKTCLFQDRICSNNNVCSFNCLKHKVLCMCRVCSLNLFPNDYHDKTVIIIVVSIII